MVRVGRLVVPVAALLVGLGSLVLAPGAARASFHLVSISELGAGFLGDPNVQFVELRLDAAGQTELTNTRLTSFDKDGIATVLLLTPSTVANGSAGRNVLYATAEFQAATGIAPDYVIPVGVVGPSGMICWGAPGAVPPDPMSWDFDKPENYVDCVAYGSYPHTRRPASGAASALTPGNGVQALVRQKNTSAAGSNDMDFALAAASACNNANQCTALTPGPQPTPGKAERACRRAIIKAATNFAAAYGKARVGCETQRLKGKLAGACPDAKTAAKIAAADAKRSKVVTKACGALPLAQTGFGASCPGVAGACTAPIAAIGDVSACVDCGLRRGGDELAADRVRRAARRERAEVSARARQSGRRPCAHRREPPCALRRRGRTRQARGAVPRREDGDEARRQGGQASPHALRRLRRQGQGVRRQRRRDARHARHHDLPEPHRAGWRRVRRFRHRRARHRGRVRRMPRDVRSDLRQRARRDARRDAGELHDTLAARRREGL